MRASHIDELLDLARSRLHRVEVSELDAELANGALLVDIRPESTRRDEGAMPGAVVVDRLVLEWRLDPTSEHCLPEARDGRRVILMCNDGYASSLSAVTLLDLGLADATDLVDGYRAWRRAHDDDGPARRPTDEPA